MPDPTRNRPNRLGIALEFRPNRHQEQCRSETLRFHGSARGLSLDPNLPVPSVLRGSWRLGPASAGGQQHATGCWGQPARLRPYPSFKLGPPHQASAGHVRASTLAPQGPNQGRSAHSRPVSSDAGSGASGGSGRPTRGGQAYRTSRGCHLQAFCSRSRLAAWWDPPADGTLREFHPRQDSAAVTLGDRQRAVTAAFTILKGDSRCTCVILLPSLPCVPGW